MEIRNDIKYDEDIRNSFFDLAKCVFGLDLKGWYENGFWMDDYIPYCVVEDGKVVSNVAVNVCNIKGRSRIRHLAQLGTVMTDPDYREKGYIRAVMEKVLSYCDRSFEGTYLYADEDMIPFYEKFGFRRIYEYQCTKKVNITNKPTVEQILMDSREECDRMVDIIQRRGQYGKRVMVGNPGLFMFHITGNIPKNVYYVPSSEAYAVANVEGDRLTLYAIFSSEKVGLGDVISAFGSEIKQVTLAFTPENNTGFEIKRIESPDSVLLTQGEVFSGIGSDRFMFPEISHA